MPGAPGLVSVEMSDARWTRPGTGVGTPGNPSGDIVYLERDSPSPPLYPTGTRSASSCEDPVRGVWPRRR